MINSSQNREGNVSLKCDSKIELHRNLAIFNPG
jgi:hypothetical protein